MFTTTQYLMYLQIICYIVSPVATRCMNQPFTALILCLGTQFLKAQMSLPMQVPELKVFKYKY